MRPKVFLTRQIPQNGIEKLEKEFEVYVWGEYSPPPKEIIIKYIEKMDAIVTLSTDPIDREVLSKAKNLRIIAQYDFAYDNIDIDACTEKGIYVTNTPNVLVDAVADFTFALILAVTRKIIVADRFVRIGEWEKTRAGWHPLMFLGMELKGKIIGIVGMGPIGQAVATRAKAFGMNIVYYDEIRRPEVEKKLGVKYVSLEELLRMSDIVSLHLPLTNKTYKFIGERELKMMKKTAYLINTARGKIIDEKALYKALKEGWIAGAGLDVFWREPIKHTHPLVRLKNVVVTPHISSATEEARRKMAALVAENLIAFKKGKIPPNLINKNVTNIRTPGFH